MKTARAPAAGASATTNKKSARKSTRSKSRSAPASAGAAIKVKSGLQRRIPRKPRRLTPAEKQVIRLLSLGCTVKQAAEILGKSPHTIENQKFAAMLKLGTDKVALVTRLAIKMRISPLNDKLTSAEKRSSGRANDGWN